jgi:hypothetical protein
MAELNAGGRVAIKLDNQWYHPVADVEIEGSSIEPEAVTNQDGSVQRTVKPKPYRAKITFRDRKGLDIERLIETCGFDATFDEKDMKRVVHFTNAFVTGVASRNTSTGEISGLMVETEQCKVSER